MKYPKYRPTFAFVLKWIGGSLPYCLSDIPISPVNFASICAVTVLPVRTTIPADGDMRKYFISFCAFHSLPKNTVTSSETFERPFTRARGTTADDDIIFWLLNEL